jgi:hypothetical protein
MQGTVLPDTETSARVDGVSVNFIGQCCPFPDDQNIQKRNCADSISIADWVVGLTAMMGLRKFLITLGHEARTQMSTYHSVSNGLYCTKSRANFPKCS